MAAHWQSLTWLTFWIGALACYRATVLLTRCLGPFDVFRKLRSIDRCSKLLKCPFCVSVWLGGLTALGLWWAGISAPWPIWIMLALAFSAVTIALDKMFTIDHNP